MTKRQRPRTLWSHDIGRCVTCGADVLLSAVQRRGEAVRPARWLPELRAFQCAPCGGLVVEDAQTQGQEGGDEEAA